MAFNRLDYVGTRVSDNEPRLPSADNVMFQHTGKLQADKQQNLNIQAAAVSRLSSLPQGKNEKLKQEQAAKKAAKNAPLPPPPLPPLPPSGAAVNRLPSLPQGKNEKLEREQAVNKAAKTPLPPLPPDSPQNKDTIKSFFGVKTADYIAKPLCKKSIVDQISRAFASAFGDIGGAIAEVPGAMAGGLLGATAGGFMSSETLEGGAAIGEVAARETIGGVSAVVGRIVGLIPGILIAGWIHFCELFTDGTDESKLKKPETSQQIKEFQKFKKTLEEFRGDSAPSQHVKGRPHLKKNPIIAPRATTSPLLFNKALPSSSDKQVPPLPSTLPAAAAALLINPTPTPLSTSQKSQSSLPPQITKTSSSTISNNSKPTTTTFKTVLTQKTDKTPTTQTTSLLSKLQGAIKVLPTLTSSMSQSQPSSLSSLSSDRPTPALRKPPTIAKLPKFINSKTSK